MHYNWQDYKRKLKKINREKEEMNEPSVTHW
jgi:hypothetical protein